MTDGLPNTVPSMPERGRPPRRVRDARRGLALAVVLVAAVTFLFQGSQARHFGQAHWEDYHFFRHDRATVQKWTDCFTRPGVWPGLYRPLGTTCYYYAGRKLFDNRLEVYHSINFALFVLNGVLVFVIASRVLPLPWAMVAPVLFVSRHAHIQLLRYTSEFQGLFSATLGLVAFLLFTARRKTPLHVFLGITAFVLGLATKETIVVVPALGALHAWLFDRRPSGAPVALAATVGAVWLAARPAILRAIGAPMDTGFAWDVSSAVFARYAAYMLEFSNTLVGPALNIETPDGVLAAAHRAIAGAAVVALGVASAAVMLRVRPHPFAPARPRAIPRPVRVAAFGVMWFLVAATPFVVLRDRPFMRYAYLPHVGLSLGVAATLALAYSLLRLLMATRSARRPPTKAPAAI